MSTAIRIKIGSVWFTGAPTDPTPEEGPQGLAFTQRSAMEMLSGPDFDAQVPRDLLQRGVTASWAMTKVFSTVTAKAAYLTGLLSLAPGLSYQADVIVRWPHEDGGYTESLMPWAALRIQSITEEGPTTLRLLCQVLAAELQDHALYSRPFLSDEDGDPILTEDGEGIVMEEESFRLVMANPSLLPAILTETGGTGIALENGRTTLILETSTH